MNNGRVMLFKHGQELASGIVHFIKYQRDNVPAKCIEILTLLPSLLWHFLATNP